MEVRESGEFGLVARIRNRLIHLSPDFLMGTGDDAAIASSSPGSDLVSIVDLLREGVHFDLALISAHLLGRRALAAKG